MPSAMQARLLVFTLREASSLALGRNWQGDRFSPLTRITADTAGNLRLRLGVRIPFAPRPR
jgi:hypothetical protein